MILNVAGILIFLSVFGIVVSNPDRAVDCRKFVFAPLCRGVAAKRGALGNTNNGDNVFIDEESFRLFLKNLSALLSLVGDEDNEQVADLIHSHEVETLGRKYRPSHHFLRLLLKNRSNSERDNSPVQEAEN